MTTDKLKRILATVERPVVSFAEQRRMDEQVNLRFTASEIASLIRLALAARGPWSIGGEYRCSICGNPRDKHLKDCALAAVFGEGDDHA